ncbi:MAG: PaeR7I family type II restriction endonuclease [Armatimonadota bacterium]
MTGPQRAFLLVLLAASALVAGCRTPPQAVSPQAAAPAVRKASHKPLAPKPVIAPSTNAKRVAVTIDDGPSLKYVLKAMDCAEAHGSRVTFFVTGRWLVKDPQIARRISERGHEIGNHTWDHVALAKCSPAKVRNELTRVNDLIVKSQGERPTVFRPPYGSHNATVDKVGRELGSRDRGARSEVTGGAQMDGFTEVVVDLLCRNGVPKACVQCARRSTQLPGWFRPEKQWDLVVIQDDSLIAAIEFKSHIGSFGNNFNNRVEEALGNASDIQAAYREGAFRPSARPWLGYLMLLEEAEGSTRPVKVAEPNFPVLDEFRGTSYLERYGLLLRKLVRERLYDAGCLVTSSKVAGAKGHYHEPDEELTIEAFMRSLLGHAIGVTSSPRPHPD